MIKNIKIILPALVIFSFSLQAIQNTTVYVGTGLVATLCAGGSYTIHNKMQPISPFIFGSVSFLMTAATYILLQRGTPAGRIKRANILLNDVARHTLARTCFNNEKTFFDAVQDVYLTDDLPLISAYNHLTALLPSVHYALCLINKASAEVGKDVLLQEECDASLSRANILFKNISDAIKRIRGHKDYLPQLTIYKENLAHQQQTIAQQQLAAAHQDIAQAKQSSLWVKWLKFIFG